MSSGLESPIDGDEDNAHESPQSPPQQQQPQSSMSVLGSPFAAGASLRSSFLEQHSRSNVMMESHITQSPPVPISAVVSLIHAGSQFDETIEEIAESSNGSGNSSERDISPSANDLMMNELLPSDLEYPPLNLLQPEPIVVRGNGNMTLFGLSNTFSTEFPASLLGRVSREEFEMTIGRINHLLRQHHSTNAKLLLLGCLCCCCSFGCSLLWPTLALSKRTRTMLEKLLAAENHKLYHKLGLNWKLSKERCHSNHAFMEYVLYIEHLPKLHIYQPD